jgi:hypothetical protein
LVEHQLPKLRVAGSIPVVRSSGTSRNPLQQADSASLRGFSVLPPIDGWPGGAPEELVENLLAVLRAAAATETDPARKGRLERLIETIREVGVATAGEVLSKVVLGL